MNKFRYILPLFFLMSVGIVKASQSLNVLENGSFELPAVPAGQGSLPAPAVPGWDISGTYWAIFTANGGVSPIPEGNNELYLYVGTAVHKAGKIADNCNYDFSVKISANNDLIAPKTSFAVMEAVSPDGSRVYELAKTYFGTISTSYLWYTFRLSCNNLPRSNLAGYDLRVRIYAAGMLNIDDAILKVTTDRIVIDDFESYKQQSQLQQKWVAHSGAQIALENESQDRFLGRQSMKLQYNVAAGGFAEVQYDMSNCIFGPDLEQSLSGELILNFCGNRVNTSGGQLYVRIQDTDGRAYTIYSNADLADEDMQLRVINIRRFSSAGVDTGDIDKLVIGVVNPENTACSGAVYIDNIELPPQSRKIFNADITADGDIDIEDFIVLSDDWLATY